MINKLQNSQSLRILYSGETWFGSCARACSAALRRQGHDVLTLDPRSVIPLLRKRSSRLIVRLFLPKLTREYNDLILDASDKFRPNIFFTFKGSFVETRTLKILRERGIRLYNYYPDRVIFESQTSLGQSLAEYDCMFDTKRSWDEGASEFVNVRELAFVPHGYDSDVHRPVELSNEDRSQYGCDVSLIASHSLTKEHLLVQLLKLLPGLNLRIWGDGWKSCNSPALTPFIQGWAPLGDQYARAIQASRINLGIMGIKPDAHDETSTRTYEIPACGGFMLHERTPEVHGLYKEGMEIECFDSPQELADKITFYLAHSQERAAIARAGHVRCVPAYSYDSRVAEIMSWHFRTTGQESPVLKRAKDNISFAGAR